MAGLLWGLRRVSRGRSFGNEIADSLCISRNMFHTSMEFGGVAQHLIVLAAIKDNGVPVSALQETCARIVYEGALNQIPRFGETKIIVKTLSTLEEFIAKDYFEGNVVPGMSAMSLFEHINVNAA